MKSSLRKLQRHEQRVDRGHPTAAEAAAEELLAAAQVRRSLATFPFRE
jgi:hypothetical protein